jgi:hypothetical protein
MTAPPTRLPFGLAPGIHVARLGERIVVLDRSRDDYSLLVGPPAQALIELFGSGALAPALEPLEAAGLIDPTSRRRPAAITPAAQDHAGPGVQPRPADALAALLACAATAARLRWLGLERTCRRLEAVPGGRSDAAALAEALAAFASARRWYPRTPRCLFDSLALLAFLRGRGLAARAVFGVRLDPFGAHCWVEAAGRVVNDRVATTRAFTPIMVV